MKRYYSKQLYMEMEDAFCLIDLKRFNRLLRTMVFHYIKHQPPTNPPDYRSLLADVEIFFNFLDVAEDEDAARTIANQKD